MKTPNVSLTILFLTLACNGHAQDTPSGLEAYFTSAIVRDIEISTDWYQRILGFEVVNQTESKERGFKQSNLTRAGSALELIQMTAAVSPGDVVPDYNSKTRIVGLFKAGFRVDNFDAWLNHFRKEEVNIQGRVVTDPVTEHRMIILLDPDGNRIQIFEK